ncbi:MAG: HipA domain-containing protein [Parvibaculum sp.]|nr:HipA domain-containing protein [Parvibaculum sp.]
MLFKDAVAGTLSQTPGGGTRFAYVQGWKDQIACCFPTTRDEYEWRNGLHPFFEHLGPEGWLREQQARVAHVVQENDFGLLLRYGADCIGAVGVRPPSGSAPFPEITELTANPGRTVSGVQKKLLVVKKGDTFEPAAATGPAPFIAKFNSERLPTLVRNEALSLRWAAEVLGKEEINRFQQAQIAAIGEFALVVTRFDRGPKGEKLRQEDCAQILLKPRGPQYDGKYDAAYEDIAAVIKQHSSRPAIDLLRFYRRLIAFALIGNCDAHLKNFSLLETPSGLRLSPAYDVLNTAIYDGYDQTLALSIGGRKAHLDTVDGALFRTFGRDIGIPDRAIDQTFVNLKRRTGKAATIIQPPEAEEPGGFKSRYAEIVNNTCLRVLGA